MTGPELLAAEVGILRTEVGACWPGTRAVFRGHDLHRDLHGIDWIELYAFGITGRRLRAEEVRLLHGIWATTSYPDTRLWNNRVGAIAGSARSSPGLGLAASIAVSEAGIYGGGPGVRAIDFFLRAGQAIKGGVSIREFVFAELNARRILGYGRPINSTDERLPPLIKLVESLGLDQGIHYRLAFAVENILVTEHKPFLKMNYAAITAALAADLGFTPRQYQLFNNLKFVAGMPPCILEAAEKPAGTLFPTRCCDIDYQGQGPRNWPVSTISSNIAARNPRPCPISKGAAPTT